MRRWEGLCLVLLLATGCAGSRALCPIEGGRPWSEVRSKHFRIQTNMTPEAATKTALELEKYRRALLLAWGRDFDPPGTVDVIVLRNATELDEFSEGQFIGFATTVEGRPLLVMGGNGYLLEDSPDLRLQAHELTHHLSSYTLLRQPRWVSEGLAEYLETVHIRVSTNEAVLGRANAGRFGYVREHGWLDLEELWKWDEGVVEGAAETQRHYASAWLWVHYLINMHPKRFSDFQRRLALAQEPRRAWEAAFQGVEDLKGGLRDYVIIGRYAIATHPLPPVPTQVEVRPLEPADAHAVRAMLYLHSPNGWSAERRDSEARREVTQGMKEGPTNVSATLLSMRLGGKASRKLEAARALVAAHPEDGRAWNLLAGLLPEKSQEREEAHVRATALLPDDARILEHRAWHSVRREEPEKGLEAARRAAALLPGDATVLDTYALLLFQVGRCPEAMGVQRRAMDMLHERAPAKMRRVLSQRLQSYEAECGATAPVKP
ncbi:DUF1570 domain-containing protein [Pyxidicoccus fallax]|uniref:DUF1570 domain-containing protein n=2 Tax=Pyxidicoccus fallax TaxID=394095 RepID=A0A848LQP0_9BACT|nr:DUF1570 domain-containing protein [Pyxidicoccus fallax]NPC80546.1 DUF1570 domain-containing protein [Pyxidicoccus fallax]